MLGILIRWKSRILQYRFPSGGDTGEEPHQFWLVPARRPIF